MIKSQEGTLVEVLVYSREGVGVERCSSADSGFRVLVITQVILKKCLNLARFKSFICKCG